MYIGGSKVNILYYILGKTSKMTELSSVFLNEGSAIFFKGWSIFLRCLLTRERAIQEEIGGIGMH